MGKKRHVFITREHALYAAKNAVRKQGYAVAVHGSMTRDLDLIAVPWRETAIDAQHVAEIIAAAIPGVLQGEPEQKPYGRMGFVIYPRWHYGFDNWYVDLSVMPRCDPPAKKHEPREGMVTVHHWDGSYLGCMGIKTWEEMLKQKPPAEGGDRDE